ncbi:hypothetical protein FQN50_006896 [Emmonsiellopsis sp. PD_5]|nr:hypothetical protein FQN50_006896 [Emmonsiellopsis sp. PD_5]
MASKAPYIVPALTRHTATVIMAHGLGDRMALAQNWRRRGMFDEVSFVFPNAPLIPITVNFGTHMPGWYDIVRLGGDLATEDFYKHQDEPGILRSRDYFNTLIATEIAKGIKPSRIVLGGFSQGGAMALFTGLTTKEKLGGIFGMSCYVPLGDRLETLMTAGEGEGGAGFVNKETPVFMAHGDADVTVRFEWGWQSVELLRGLGMGVEFHKYPDMGHTADPLEIEDLAKYLETVVPAEDGNAQKESKA